MKIHITVMTGLTAFFLNSAAMAADAPAKKPAAHAEAPVARTAAAASAVPVVAKTNSISVEFGPEFFANVDGYNKSANNGGNFASNNDIRDWTGRIAYGHTFGGVWAFGASVSQVAFYSKYTTTGVAPQPTPDSQSSTKTEVTLGYKYKIVDSFTLTPGVGLGYSWGISKIHNPGGDPGVITGAHGAGAKATCSSTATPDAGGNAYSCYDAEAYYQATLAGDWKLNSEWTWNVFNVRYRNAFVGNWVTPKVSTGVTYAVTPDDAVYASVGLAWKNAYSNSLELCSDYEDATNLTLGYRHAF